MANDRPTRACLWLRVSTDGRGQDPGLQRDDLDRVCQQRGWEIVQVYEAEESGYGKKPREQFQAMLNDARRGGFEVVVTWSMNRFSREGGWSVSRVLEALQDWEVRFYSFSEPFLDTSSGPFAEFLAPLRLAGQAGELQEREGRPSGYGQGPSPRQLRPLALMPSATSD